uniref:Zinc carboxypeptidase A 1 n=1 Tax=Phlebotomus papatasi TaxID=29031 RepID=A0A1B0DHR3_PHLPP
WGYGGAGIKLTYVYEFRDNGTHGFLLPPDQIIPNSIEVMQSLIGMIDESERLGHLSMHSFSQLLLYPYGWTSAPAADAESLNQIGRAAADRLRVPFGTEYAVHSMNNLYIATGTSGDSFSKIYTFLRLVDKQDPANQPRNTGFWERYQTMDEINVWMDQMLAQHGNVLTPITYGNSYEMEPIRGFLMSYRAGNPAIFVESNIHAREWITAASTTWLINEFVTSTDPEIRRIAESYDWYIFPVTNPDGYRHSHDVNRMWRTTRSRHGLLCRGADPNRNFGYRWQDGTGPGASDNSCSQIFAGPYAFSELETGQLANYVLQRLDHIKMYFGLGASNDPCSPAFAGPYPFSEVETGQLANYVLERLDHIKVYLSMHSFSELLMYPYGWTSAPAADAESLNQIGRAAADRLRVPFGTEYAVHSINSLVLATGTSGDWGYGGAGIKLTYVYEFRDNGTHGFLLPPEQIIPNSIEVMQSFIGLIDESERLGFLAVKMRNLIVFSVVILLAFSSAEKVRFDNYKVYKVQIDNEEQLHVMHEIEKAAFSSYDFWRSPSYVGNPVEIMVAPHKLSEFEEIMESLKYDYILKITNVQE